MFLVLAIFILYIVPFLFAILYPFFFLFFLFFSSMLSMSLRSKRRNHLNKVEDGTNTPEEDKNQEKANMFSQIYGASLIGYAILDYKRYLNKRKLRQQK